MTLPPALVAEARALAGRITALARVAERAGRAAQQADETAHDTALRSAAAERTRARAAAASAEAVRRAAASRRRAAAIAARLARTDLGTLPLSLLLDARSADRVLGGLSTADQLSSTAHLAYGQATKDAGAARHLAALASAKASAAAKAQAAAARAQRTARAAATAASAQVQRAALQQRTLLARLLSVNEGRNVCPALTGAALAICLPAATVDPADVSVGGRVLRYAIAQIGKPYVFGAAGPDAFDCSGLTLSAYASAGVSIGPHSATAQFDLARARDLLVPVGAARPGDLLFYTDGGGDMYHVTVYAGNGLMIEAPYPGATVREAPVRSQDLVESAARFR